MQLALIQKVAPPLPRIVTLLDLCPTPRSRGWHQVLRGGDGVLFCRNCLAKDPQ